MRSSAARSPARSHHSLLAVVPLGSWTAITLKPPAVAARPVSEIPLDVTPLDVTPLDVTPLDVTPLDVTPLVVMPLRPTPLVVMPLRPTPLVESPLVESPLAQPALEGAADAIAMAAREAKVSDFNM